MIYKIAEEQKADTETVIEMMKDKGICAGVAICKRCGKKYPVYLSEYCHSCDGYLKEMRKYGDLHKKCLEFGLKSCSIRKANCIRQMVELDLEIQKLKEELKAYGEDGTERDYSRTQRKNP